MGMKQENDQSSQPEQVTVSLENQVFTTVAELL